MARIKREQEQTIRSIQKAREEKEAEELRRHNEIVAALKEAGYNTNRIRKEKVKEIPSCL